MNTHKITINNAEIELNDATAANLEKQLKEYLEATRVPETLEDCHKALSRRVTNYDTYYLDCDGDVTHHNSDVSVNLFPSAKRPLQLAALTKLMQVADALNGEDCTAPKGNGKSLWCLSWDANRRDIGIGFLEYTVAGQPFFKTKQLADRARQILGDDLIKQALGIF